MKLTIAYITARQRPHFDWFFDSLARQNNYHDLIYQVIVVDQCLGNNTTRESPHPRAGVYGFPLYHVPPKPTVWQGEYRLTKKDFFDQANARNTAICSCPNDWIAFVDDLSVLGPLWLDSIKKAMAGNYAVCGAYEKANKLVVKNGRLISREKIDGGMDSRWKYRHSQHPSPCPGNFFLGCSNAAPIQAFLDINGYPEHLTGGMGYEDCITGTVMAKHGYKFRYDRDMFTTEAADLHFQEPVLLRFDPGKSPNDKSHAMIEIAKKQSRFENFFGHGFHTIAQLRNHILNGGKFPIRKRPHARMVHKHSAIRISHLSRQMKPFSIHCPNGETVVFRSRDPVVSDYCAKSSSCFEALLHQINKEKIYEPLFAGRTGLTFRDQSIPGASFAGFAGWWCGQRG